MVCGRRYRHSRTGTSGSARLAESLDRQERALRNGDFATFATSALGFHRGFVALSNNIIMLSRYDRMRDRQHLSIG